MNEVRREFYDEFIEQITEKGLNTYDENYYLRLCSMLDWKSVDKAVERVARRRQLEIQHQLLGLDYLNFRHFVDNQFLNFYGRTKNGREVVYIRFKNLRLEDAEDDENSGLKFWVAF